MPSPPQRHVIVVALPCVQLLDVSGPMDVFSEANRQAGFEAYRIELYATKTGHLVASSGIRLVPDGVTTGDVRTIDTLLVAGAPTSADDHLSRGVLDWLAVHSSRARRFGSVCTGAFALAAAGLLHKRRVTTHWASAERLVADYPDVDVDIDAIYVNDGALRTAAGVTAGLDLALSLVEEDLGTDIAKLVAAQLVMYFRRPGGQSHFSRSGEARVAARSSLQELMRWVIANPSLDHTVASLAERLHMSPRHFARVFSAELQMAPGAWIDEVRLAAAKKLLEGEGGAPKKVAAACGFSDSNSFRRAFTRAFGISPAQYRRLYADA
jgi:transcriptional regulator GlxA family with amidase domain